MHLERVEHALPGDDDLLRLLLHRHRPNQRRHLFKHAKQASKRARGARQSKRTKVGDGLAHTPNTTQHNTTQKHNPTQQKLNSNQHSNTTSKPYSTNPNNKTRHPRHNADPPATATHLFRGLPLGQLSETLLPRPNARVDDLEEQLSRPRVEDENSSVDGLRRQVTLKRLSTSDKKRSHFFLMVPDIRGEPKTTITFWGQRSTTI